MAALEALDRIHQRLAVSFRVGRNTSINRQVADESQQGGETRYTCIRLAGINGFGDNRKSLPLVRARYFNVARECQFGQAITGKGRFHLVQYWLQVRSGQNLVAQKLGQVVLLVFHTEPKV